MKGSLVRSKENDLGIGKLMGFSEKKARVEYFKHIGELVINEISVSSLEHARLQPQTRCYVKPKDNQEWQIGRIGFYDRVDNTYEVSLPGKRANYYPESEIYVRCNRPIEDPTDVLVLKSQETPFFHDHRAAFVRSVIEQRSVAQGMTGLISSNIDLYAHQVEVARRVLEDPTQRYLLADEVGLGKTVEAGIILRQYLLDNRDGQAIVVVPKYLLEQWQRELEEKFPILDVHKRLYFGTVDELDELSSGLSDHKLGMVIIDEAHHIAAAAYSSDENSRRRFEACRRISHNAERLLLLSATPVLNHERDFLAMLHLLDPANYKLEDLEAFKERVSKRQEIGRILLSFQEGAHPFILRANAKRLRELFHRDERLQGLLNEWDVLLQSDGTDIISRDAIVRSIRIHISETYRLHRRMLRNRRDSVELAARMEAGREAVDLKEEYDSDDRAITIHEMLDEWRVRIVGSLTAPSKDFERIFLTLFLASGTWLGLLERVIESRLNGVADPLLKGEFGAVNISSLCESHFFEGEKEILQAMLDTLRKPAEEEDRIQLLVQALRLHRNAGSKVVVFTSFTSTCSELVRQVSLSFGAKAVAIHQEGYSIEDIEGDIDRFRSNPDCFVLICDSSGEEGRNLQFSDWLIHFDIPWSPNRMEQRIGRLDRIGRNRSVRSRVFIGPDAEGTLHESWYHLLRDGFGVFNHSIASLQFYVDEKLSELAESLFRYGASGIVGLVDTVRCEIEDEKVKISEQNALDEIDFLDQDVNQYFHDLQTYDSRAEEIRRQTEGWVCHALKFRKCTDPSQTISYRPDQNTLVPPDILLKLFAVPLVNRSGTYKRSMAVQVPNVSLYRIGDAFIDALIDYVHWDDRGRAFAVWRCDPEWSATEGAEWLGFRFNFIVEARTDPALAAVSKLGLEGIDQRALSRRADALFPPMLETIYINADMQIAEDETLLKILQRPYSNANALQRDFNLAKDRLGLLNNIIDPDRWAELCRHARRVAEATLRGQAVFQDECSQRAEDAERELGKRAQQLALRLERENDNPSTRSLSTELEFEYALSSALVEGIRDPLVRLDALGFIVVSGRSPK
jgi:ATP-dependent helicase HepA